MLSLLAKSWPYFIMFLNTITSIPIINTRKSKETKKQNREYKILRVNYEEHNIYDLWFMITPSCQVSSVVKIFNLKSDYIYNKIWQLDIRKTNFVLLCLLFRNCLSFVIFSNILISDYILLYIMFQR